jgi:hypothetical protein
MIEIGTYSKGIPGTRYAKCQEGLLTIFTVQLLIVPVTCDVDPVLVWSCVPKGPFLCANATDLFVCVKMSGGGGARELDWFWARLTT